MEMKCSMCNSILSNSNLKFTCSHFLCNKCLSRKLLISKLSPLTTTKCVEMNCSCGGKITVPYSTCLKNISGVEVQKKKDKLCKNHKNKSDSYCPICRLWLCRECISSFHSEYFKNHKLCPEDKMLTSKCFYHRNNTNEIYCKNCSKLICKQCLLDKSNPENDHSNHGTYTLDEYHNLIRNKKKRLKYKSYEEIMKFIDAKEIEITKDFSDKCEESKNYIEDAIKKLDDIKNNYISKYEQQINNLKNIFGIIRQSYSNFYKEMEGDKIDLYSFDFISKINGELNNIIYVPLNFDLIKSIHTSLDKINQSKYYNIKFNFRALFYEKNQTIDLDEGVTSICPLKSISKSFACGTSNGQIKIYTKEDDYEYSLVAETKIDNRNSRYSVDSLIELKKIDNCLLSVSNGKTIKMWAIDISSNQDNKTNRLSCKKEINNEGIVLSILELNDGRIASSTSDNKIKIWNLNDKEEIKIENQNNNLIVCYEACLVEASIFENDENNKQLISGGRKGRLKCWDIYSGKLGKIFECNNSLITCIININNHILGIGTGDGIIIILNLYDENNKKYLLGHKNSINSICYLKTKQNLFSCSKDMTIKIWDLETLKCTNTFYRQHTSIIYGIIICGNDLISCSNDCSINVYSTGENENNNDLDEEENYNEFE